MSDEHQHQEESHVPDDIPVNQAQSNHPLLPGNGAYTMPDLVARQDQLQEDAKQAIPFDVGSCTQSLGPLKQNLYACLNCKNTTKQRNAVCGACAVRCHADCGELVELFARRNFVCDCGTTRTSKKCNLTNQQGAVPASENQYMHNFDGHFCDCKALYDAEEESDSMIQCIVCQDWYHLSHLSDLFNRDTVTVDDFDELICHNCAEDKVKDIVAAYAGVQKSGVMLLDDNTESWEGAIGNPGSQNPHIDPALNGKRKAGHEEDGPDAKRSRLECKAPIPPKQRNARFQALSEASNENFNVYLQEGWRDRWCRCDECAPMFADVPYFFEEEEIFEPAADPDARS